MKKVLIFLLAAACSAAIGSAQTVTNRYGMKLNREDDGSYSLQKREKYAALVDLDKLDGLLTPYIYEAKDLSSKMYKQTKTSEHIYKTEGGKELKLYVDQAVTGAPGPFVIHCHGGGWARGTADSGRSLTQYLAQQHGITGVRVEYILAGEKGADIEASVQDVLDAVKYVQDNAELFNIDPRRVGFIGTSAGAHLAACAAMKCKDAKVFVGFSGIYDLTTAAIVQKSKDPARIAYFEDRDEAVLRSCSPALLMTKKKKLNAQLYCGTADITVEYSQSEEFARALQRCKSNVVDLQIYPNYDHGLGSKTNDKMEEIFFKSAGFIAGNL